ncbi:MAG: FMN-binding protein [Actinomycetota bacterium]
MRLRTIITMLVTGLALTLLLSFKTPSLVQPAHVAHAHTAIHRKHARRTIARPSIATHSVIAAPAASQSAQAPSTSASSSPSRATRTPTPQATKGRYKNGSYDGATSDTQYGPVQVRVIVSGGKITDVQALQMPSSHQRSQEISAEAGPKLRQEVLQAQSANIDTVSGATYTSEGYRQSVQSALDQAAN